MLRQSEGELTPLSCYDLAFVEKGLVAEEHPALHSAGVALPAHIRLHGVPVGIDVPALVRLHGCGDVHLGSSTHLN
jgi:hypothetical protein